MAKWCVHSGCVLLVVTFPFADHRVAAAETKGVDSEADQVYRFLDENLIGKTLERKSQKKIANDTVEAEFVRRMQFLNLTRTAETISFDLIALIKQTNYDLDDRGRRLDKPPQVTDRSLVSRCMVRRLKSTGKLVGSLTMLTSSTGEPGTPDGLQIRMEGGSLVMVQTTSLYDDFFAAAGAFKPAASRTKWMFSVEQDQLRLTTQEAICDVDPATLERKPWKSDRAPSVDYEVESLF